MQMARPHPTHHGGLEHLVANGGQHALVKVLAQGAEDLGQARDAGVGQHTQLHRHLEEGRGVCK